MNINIQDPDTVLLNDIKQAMKQHQTVMRLIVDIGKKLDSIYTDVINRKLETETVEFPSD